MISILSMDVSSVSTGWSVIINGKPKDYGLIKPPDGYDLSQKLLWFRNDFRKLLKLYQPSHVVVEETYMRNVKTLKTLVQFVGIINVECLDLLDLRPSFVSPNTVRSEFGLKTKEDVFKAVQSKYKAKFKHLTFDEGNDITDSVLQGIFWWNMIDKEKKDG